MKATIADPLGRTARREGEPTAPGISRLTNREELELLKLVELRVRKCDREIANSIRLGVNPDYWEREYQTAIALKLRLL